MQHLTETQIKSLLETARKHSERDYLMILLAYRHGLRASEVCSLAVSQFDVTADAVYLTVQRLKGSLCTTQPLMADEKQAVLNWINGKQPGDFLFIGKKPGTHVTRVTFFLNFRKHCKTTGIIPKHLSHPHVAKHSTAMAIIQKAGIENTRRYLGHRSLQSTAAYLKADDAMASAAAHAAFGAAVGF